MERNKKAAPLDNLQNNVFSRRTFVLGGKVWLARKLLSAMPVNIGFCLVVFYQHLRSSYGVTQLFAYMVAPKIPTLRQKLMTSWLARSFPGHVAVILGFAGYYTDALLLHRQWAQTHIPYGKIVSGIVENHLRLLLETGCFDEAAELVNALPASARNDVAERYRAYLHLIHGEEAAAAAILQVIVQRSPHLWRPHQNLSYRQFEPYAPTSIDMGAGADGLLYDAYNYLGQRAINSGLIENGVEMYAGAFRAQKRLRMAVPAPSEALAQYLASVEIDFSELRIFPPEWAAQIGHLGMLDIHLRLRDLGWWQGKPIILADNRCIANRACLAIFEHVCPVLIRSVNVSIEIWDELISLQRYLGFAFNAWEMPDGKVVPWQEAGALALPQWEQRKLPNSFRDIYDQHLAPEARALEARLRNAVGMKPGGWHVCLHIRDAGFYRELVGLGQTHRNAEFKNYVEAVKFIIAQGGHVIRMGSADAPPLPDIPGLFDYARSSLKSPLMDLHLIRTARLFIGMTSGLTNMAISFGTPAALVNCITTDAQLWNSGVRFALKPVRKASGGILSQGDLTTSEARWKIFAAELMARHGLQAVENTPDEILETVREALAPCGEAALPLTQKEIVAAWRHTLPFPHYYGGALPSIYYLEKYGESFVGTN